MDDNELTSLSSSLSFIGSVILFSSFFICQKWVNTQREAKAILFTITIFDGMTALNYFAVQDSNGIFCRLQATSIQFFEIGKSKPEIKFQYTYV
jgi:hypothetical protein